MASDYQKQTSLQWYLKNYKTQAEIEAMLPAIFTALQDGRTVTSVSFEGGSAGALVTCDPSILLAACQGALADLGVKPAALSTIFTRFNMKTLET